MGEEKCTARRSVMDKNPFGKTSKLYIKAIKKEERTVLGEVSFTAPFKIMEPFRNKDGSIQTMLLSASAGIMQGDEQEFLFQVDSGADMEFLSQSYEKVHKMKEGCASRNAKIHVDKEACFRYHPQPTIPFKDSAFESRMEVYLEDDTSHFYMGEILSCGRYAVEERFAYRYYYNLIEIYRKNQLIYRDNSRYDPKLFDMEGMGMYESYTHMANLFMTKVIQPEAFIEYVRKLLERREDVEGGITKLIQGDYAVRILGRRAQPLEQLLSEIAGYWHELGV